jgi:hypothetical protein
MTHYRPHDLLNVVLLVVDLGVLPREIGAGEGEELM